jgi:Uma2 family endonuclease
MTVAALRVLDDNGFFDGDTRRYELLEGRLIMTPPPGAAHQFAEMRAGRALNRALDRSRIADTHAVQSGGTLELNDTNLLAPDLMIIAIPDAPMSPRADMIVVVVEIAVSSRAYDLGDKARLYARAGVADYWVVDAQTRTVVVHREPVDGVYTSVRGFHAGESLRCLTAESLVVAVADLV